jgi:ribosomal subunit interface protein
MRLHQDWHWLPHSSLPSRSILALSSSYKCRLKSRCGTPGPRCTKRGKPRWKGLAARHAVYVHHNRCTTVQPTTMKNPPVHITPHHLSITPILVEFVRTKISGVSRFAGDVLAADVVLRGPTGAAHCFAVSARLALPGRDIQGNAAHPNFYTAISQLVSRLSRLARKRKTRFARASKLATRRGG